MEVALILEHNIGLLMVWTRILEQRIMGMRLVSFLILFIVSTSQALHFKCFDRRLVRECMCIVSVS